jgi:hypothetical protein
MYIKDWSGFDSFDCQSLIHQMTITHNKSERQTKCLPLYLLEYTNVPCENNSIFFTPPMLADEKSHRISITSCVNTSLHSYCIYLFQILIKWQTLRHILYKHSRGNCCLLVHHIKSLLHIITLKVCYTLSY